MTTVAEPVHRTSIARHLVRTQLAGIVWIFGFFAVGVAVVGAIIDRFVTITGSIWAGSVQVPRWFALGMGVYLLAFYLPVYVAHGRTRRETATGSARYALCLALTLGALITVGFAMEAGLYHLLGWEAVLPDPHPVGSVGAVLGTLAAQSAQALVYVAVGALCAAAFYRNPLAGLASLPVGLALGVLSELANGGDSLGPIPLPDTLLGVNSLGAAISLGAAAIAVALTWRIVREVPLKPRPT